MHDYDRIGSGYAHHRVPDPRIAAAVRDALGDATSVVTWIDMDGEVTPFLLLLDLHVMPEERPAARRSRACGAAPARSPGWHPDGRLPAGRPRVGKA